MILRIAIFVFTIIFLFSCNFGQSNNADIKHFNIAEIDSIIINSKQAANKKLDYEQAELLITRLNNSKSDGLWKFNGEYSICVYLKDKTQRTIITQAEHFKIKAEKGDWAYTVSDKLFFKELYEKK